MSGLGAKLSVLRGARQMSQRDLARASGLTPTYVAKIEDDSLRGVPSSGAIVSLAHALDADEVEFFAAAGREPSPFEMAYRQPRTPSMQRRWDRLAATLDSPGPIPRQRPAGAQL
jgi:transcriptional regulator with XRE-family HTH domain